MIRKKPAALIIHPVDNSTKLPLPFADGGIKAGFPSPAQDYMETAIDLNKELVKHPASTFYGRVKGSSMIDAGVDDGDILVIDKSIRPTTGDMAVCFIDGEFTLKYIKLEEKVIFLIPANEDFEPIKVTEDNNFVVWGIVQNIIKKPKKLFK